MLRVPENTLACFFRRVLLSIQIVNIKYSNIEYHSVVVQCQWCYECPKSHAGSDGFVSQKPVPEIDYPKQLQGMIISAVSIPRMAESGELNRK